MTTANATQSRPVPTLTGQLLLLLPVNAGQRHVAQGISVTTANAAQSRPVPTLTGQLRILLTVNAGQTYVTAAQHRPVMEPLAVFLPVLTGQLLLLLPVNAGQRLVTQGSSVSPTNAAQPGSVPILTGQL